MTKLPILTANDSFLREFVSAAPCFALGLVEQGQHRCGCVALRFDQPVPHAVLNRGFRFGHEILGNNRWQIVQFSFEFYGWETYHALLHPNHSVTRAVLPAMVETGDYFFFALDSNNSTTAFRSELGEGHLRLLREHLPLLRESTTTEAQYEQAVVLFGRNPKPPGMLLH